MSVLSLSQASAAPWGSELLAELNIELQGGEILGVVGPNGAGKTSLLNAIAGDIALSQGQIHLFDQPLSSWQPQQRARRLAILPQLSLLNFPYTIEEVILLGRIPHSSGAAQDQHILHQVMAATDTLALSDRLYTQLSGGEKQRVQLARVFAQIWPTEDQPPSLLLLDEPTAALDLAHQQLLIKTLRELAISGCAIVLVVHDFNLVASIAHQITVLKDGRQVASGSPGEVFTKEVFAEVFGVQVHIGQHPESGRPLVIST